MYIAVLINNKGEIAMNEWTKDDSWCTTGNSFEELQRVLRKIDEVTTRKYAHLKEIDLYTLHEGRYYGHSNGDFVEQPEGIKASTIMYYNDKLHDVSQRVIFSLAARVELTGRSLTIPSWKRDEYIVELCKKSKDEVAVIERAGKVFGVFSDKYAYIPQENLLGILTEACGLFGEINISFYMDQDMTCIYTEFSEKADRIACSYELSEDTIPGLYITTSDTADSAVRIQEYWKIGSARVLGKKVSRKHIGSADVDDLIEDMKHKIFSNYEYVPQRLSELSEIEIDDKAIDFEYILKKYKIEELLGKKRTKDLIPQIEMEIYGKKTAYDVVISLLTLGERLVGELSQLQKELIQERLYDILEYDFSSSRLVLT